jgi:bifunctional DNA-binding transcriptional regulator/antitoxin component of YhaV-PrlF toxin-antitoxin module
VTINGHSYRSTATAVGGQCRVVFPSSERLAAGVSGGDSVTVKLDLDDGYRHVDLHPKFIDALRKTKLREKFDNLSYSARKEFARSISEAKAEETRERRIEKAIQQISSC